MRKRLLIFGVVVVCVFGLGYLVFVHLLAEKPKEVEPPPPARVVEPPSTPEAQPAEGIKVVSTRGRVERRGSEQETWQPLKSGDLLKEEESVKTFKGASAKLRVDDKSVIDLASRSELDVREISEAVHRFKLVRGKIGVDYDESGERLLKIESAKSDAVAETRTGKFVVQNSNGIVSVATTSGQVKLTAKKKTITVKAGETSSVLPGAAPAPVKQLPLSVMLRVAKPKTLVQRERFTFVYGRTSVGAMIHVNDIQAKVSRKGRFRVRVPLKEGRNRIEVTAEDAAGNQKKAVLPIIIVDANAPIDRVDIRWGEEDKAG